MHECMNKICLQNGFVMFTNISNEYSLKLILCQNFHYWVFFCLVKSYFSSDYRDLLEKLILINKVRQIVQSKTLQIYSKNDIKEQLGALHVYVPWPLMSLYYTFTKREKTDDKNSV